MREISLTSTFELSFTEIVVTLGLPLKARSLPAVHVGRVIAYRPRLSERLRRNYGYGVIMVSAKCQMVFDKTL